MTRAYLRIKDLASTPDHEGMFPVNACTIWRWVKAGTFPAPIRIGPGVTAWPAEVVDAHRQTLARGVVSGVRKPTEARMRKAAEASDEKQAA